MSSSHEAANTTVQPGDQISSSAEQVVPLFDIIDTCLEELPELREFMPIRHAFASVISDGGQDYTALEPDMVFGLDPEDQLSPLDGAGHAVLIIEEFDALWFHALAKQFPASLNVRFLAQHVLRLGELKATCDLHDSLCDGYKTLVSRVDAEISRRLTGPAANRDRHSQHINGSVSRYGINSGPLRMAITGVEGYRWEQFNV